jgi:predicted PurR-regulated permease PerM
MTMTTESLLVVSSIVGVFGLFMGVLAYATFQESRRQWAAFIEADVDGTPNRRPV